MAWYVVTNSPDVDWDDEITSTSTATRARMVRRSLRTRSSGGELLGCLRCCGGGSTGRPLWSRDTTPDSPVQSTRPDRPVSLCPVPASGVAGTRLDGRGG